jgi:hypothetical protein
MFIANRPQKILYKKNRVRYDVTVFIYLTNSMEQSPSWEANRSFAIQETPNILCKTKVHYRIHNSLPPVLILSKIDPVHAPKSLFKYLFYIILPPMPGSS